MPAPKSKKATPVKKAAARPAAKPAMKAVSRRPVVKAVARASKPRKASSIWTKEFFMDEQDEFFAAHPNSKVLLAVFTGALVLFLYIVWSNRMDIFPQAFMW